ncbi:MAG: glycoside hydrolase family 88 protein [Candidatus Marinimicrobia bacterium]|nr:glycoside hydrolase family 88 protein [Candidatus Neomarinimicrobiota bacterium]
MKVRDKIKITLAVSGLILTLLLLSCRPQPTKNEPLRLSVKMCESVMQRSPEPWNLDPDHEPKWEYTYGLVLKAMLETWQTSSEDRIFQYVKAYYDHFIVNDSTILTYKPEDFNIDRINPGKPLFLLYEITRESRYEQAIHLLRDQMRNHPRTSESGFWHKKIYPHQMWLDGIYMASPFLAQYAKTYHEPELFNDIAKQILLIEKHTRDSKSGLLYHGWDESRQQRWADPKTGHSPHFWGRAMGWYGMALTDVLDYFPEDHSVRQDIIDVLDRFARAITAVQDPQSGLWYQVLDQGDRKGNYPESSASAMFVYTLLKGCRLGYLDPQYLAVAEKGYRGILKQFLRYDEQGNLNITSACAVAGLGGNPYRDGSYDYYVSTKIAVNDPKAVGPFILASLEMEKLQPKNK